MNVYHSKIDLWLFLVLTGAAIISAIAALGSIKGNSAQSYFVALVIFGVGVVLPMWLLISTRYYVDDSAITIRSAWIKRVIPIKSVVNLQLSSNSVSSPALSLDRVSIKFGQGSEVLISPKDRAGFMADVRARQSRAGIRQSP